MPELSQTITVADLVKYDFYVVVDKSYSMLDKDCRKDQNGVATMTRWAFAEELTRGLAGLAAKYDDDGISVVLFNGSVDFKHNVKEDVIGRIFSEIQPWGGTDTAAALQTVFNAVDKGNKPAIVVMITDGLPGSEAAVEDVIVQQTKKLKQKQDLGISMVQIGHDSGAAAFVTRLDTKLKSRGAKFDIVNTVTGEQLEKMDNPVELFLKAINEDNS